MAAVLQDLAPTPVKHISTNLSRMTRNFHSNVLEQVRVWPSRSSVWHLFYRPSWTGNKFKVVKMIDQFNSLDLPKHS